MMLTHSDHTTVSASEQKPAATPELHVIQVESEKRQQNTAHPGISGEGSGGDNPFLGDAGACSANSELFQSYLLVQNVLYHSFMEIKRKSTQKAEVRFWQSRRADFFVHLANLHRECMDLPPIHADEYRRAIAAKLAKPRDWLMPQDGLSDDDVEAFCDDYMLRWRNLNEAHPNGVEDPAADAMFVPNIKPSTADAPARKKREPVPINEYRSRRQQTDAETPAEVQLEFGLGTSDEVAPSESGVARSQEGETPQEVFGPSLDQSPEVPEEAAIEQEDPDSGTEPSLDEEMERDAAEITECAALATPLEEPQPAEPQPAEPQPDTPLPDDEVSQHPALRHAHPAFGHQGAQDARKYRPKSRYRTQWVTSGSV